MDINEIWEEALLLIKKEVTNVTFNTFFCDLKIVSVSENTITFAASSELIIKMIKHHYVLIQNSIEHISQNRYELDFIVSQEKKIKTYINPAEDIAYEKSDIIPSFINPKYTFDSFVVGNSNRFAHASSVSVAEVPGQFYNPLFIYGSSGLGKTHLMHAIANYIKQKTPKAKIMCITSEKFINDLIISISARTTPQFRNRYRNADILLIDDVQFFAGKDMAQEELFHTFNDLYNSNKQIVLTSDKLPKQIDNLDERIRTRFECGNMVDIKPPDYETRIAIIQKKAEEEGITVPFDVYCYMANSIKSNIRELEGALTRISSYSKITGKKIDLDLAEESLGSFIEKEGVIRITANQINEAVSKYYSIPISDIKGKRRTQEVSDVRQIAMYLCRTLTDMSFAIIGREYGNRHYTTVMHAVDNILNEMKTDSSLSKDIEILTKQLQNVLK